MKLTLLHRLSLLLGLLAILGVLAVACGEGEEEGPTPAATTPGAGTPAAGTPAATPSDEAALLAPASGGTAKIGGASIASEPREVRGLEGTGVLTLDDGLAAWKTRPASEDRTGVSADTIKLGRATSVTGALASYEVNWGPVDETFIERINEAGGIHGRKIELIVRDEQYNPTLAVQIAKELVEKDQVFAIYQWGSTPTFSAVCEYLDEMNVVVWAPHSGAAKCFYPTRSTQFTLYNGPDETGGLVVGRSILSQDPDAKVAYVSMSAAAGEGVGEGVKYAVEEGGGQMVANISFDPSATDLTPQAVQAATANPDWIVYMMAPETGGLSLLRALQQVVGYEGEIFWGAGSPRAGTSEQLDGAYQTLGDPAINGNTAPNDPKVLAVKKLIEGEGVRYDAGFTFRRLQFLETFVRVLEVAGPDLTREGFVQAAYLAFDGGWKCSFCNKAVIFTPEDHYGDDSVTFVRWNHAQQNYEILGQPIEFETSEGTGAIGNLSQYPCYPPSADHPDGTCPWKSQ